MHIIELKTLQSKSHKIKSCPVQVEFKKWTVIFDNDEDGPPSLEGECDGEGDEEGMVTAKLEVGNVPSKVSIEALKTFFETARSGGKDDAVANIINVKPGVFHVTFHDHRGQSRLSLNT